MQIMQDHKSIDCFIGIKVLTGPSGISLAHLRLRELRSISLSFRDKTTLLYEQLHADYKATLRLSDPQVVDSD